VFIVLLLFAIAEKASQNLISCCLEDSNSKAGDVMVKNTDLNQLCWQQSRHRGSFCGLSLPKQNSKPP